MNNKIIGLKVNNKYGVLEAQEMEFTTDPNELIQIKGVVGAGKSSVNKAINLALSAGSTRETNVDTKVLKDFDVEDRLTVNDNSLYMRTTYSGGDSTSVVYMKDKEGKIVKEPTINGKKFTPAALRDYLKTELTFGVESFISDNIKTQSEWMMKVYKDKLRDLGVVFDKSSKDYKGSILDRLEKAKIERDRKYNKVAELNAFKKRLEEEGYIEANIPEEIDIKAIEDKHKLAIKNYYAHLSDIDSQISNIELKVSKCNSVISNYNSSLQANTDLINEKEKAKVKEFNDNIDKLLAERDQVKKAIDFLTSKGFTGLDEQFAKLESIGEKKVFTPKEATGIKKDDKGRYIKEGKYTDEVEKAFEDIATLRKAALPLFKEKKTIVEPSNSFQDEIDRAKASNRVAARWAAFYEHQEADKKVKDITTEYRKIFTTLDLGVEGLKMMVINDNNDIRTVYNGSHDTKLFHNAKKEYRPISSYSETQKNILAILMQVHLLEEKEKQGVHGLRYLFLDVPIDNKTKEILISMQKKYDLQFMTTCTGDFTQDKLKKNEILIKDGYLLSNNGKNE